MQAGKDAFVRWTGFLAANIAGQYRFHLRTDYSCHVMLAQGANGYELLVNKPGLQIGQISGSSAVEVYIDLFKGLHAIKVEFQYKHIEAVFEGAVGSNAGIELVIYRMEGSTEVESPGFQRFDGDCLFMEFERTGALMARDCQGSCFAGAQASLGDGVCDKLKESSNSFKNVPIGGKNVGGFDLLCKLWHFDFGDCEPWAVGATGPNNNLSCYTDCPSQDFRRHACQHCQTVEGSRCKSFGGFKRCCLAQVDGLPIWERACLSFGAQEECSDTLSSLLSENYRGMYNPVVPWFPAPTLKAKLLRASRRENSNSYPGPDIVEFTEAGLPTDKVLCPPLRESKPGVQCYEGPWHKHGIEEPASQCESIPRFGNDQ